MFAQRSNRSEIKTLAQIRESPERRLYCSRLEVPAAEGLGHRRWTETASLFCIKQFWFVSSERESVYERRERSKAVEEREPVMCEYVRILERERFGLSRERVFWLGLSAETI